MSEHDGLSTGKKLVIGAGMAALGAATYYFFGPEGQKHRKDFKSWTIKMKADIIEKIDEAGEVTESLYHKIIDEVAEMYVKAGKAGKEEISVYAETLKKQWDRIVEEIEKDK